MSERRPFFTDLDSRAAVKGSRDPLGQMSIWTRFGRHVVGNLTTVSSSLRDFTVLILGLWCVERAIEEGSTESDLALFLKFEQLAGYARIAKGDRRPFRGVERVRQRLAEGPRVTLSAERAHQILGNQKIYGLWGLYTVPRRSSGMVTGTPPRLTGRARELVEREYVGALSKAGFPAGKALVKLLADQEAVRLDVEGKHERLAACLGRILQAGRLSAAERAFYDEHLVRGGPEDSTTGKQARLAQLLAARVGDDFAFSPAVVGKLAVQAKDRQVPGGLGFRLDRIRLCESVLAPAQALFQWLLSRNDARRADAVAAVGRAWGDRLAGLDVGRIAELEDELRECTGDDEVTALWLDIARRLAAADYERAIEDLLALNRRVMQQRGAAGPWIEARGDRLHVVYRDELGELPAKSELPDLWRSPYFLESLRLMTAQVRGASA